MNDALIAARIHLVRLYLDRPGGWPDGIDTKYDRWYSTNQAHWDALARGQSVTKTPVVVTETVTKTPVTESPVTESPPVTKTEVSLKQVGRPKKDKTVSAAERQRLSRERRKGKS